MDAYTSVSLSPGNWKIVLDNLQDHVGVLNAQFAAADGVRRTEVFVAREELQGVIEQIEDQLQ
jgi:hypothetical protein